MSVTPHAAERRRWRPSIATTLTFGLGILVLSAVASASWVVLGAAQRNTFDLLRGTSEISVASVVGRVAQHLGAAVEQAGFLARLIAEGALDPGDSERLKEVMLGALAAAPQVSGIVFVSADFHAVRVGRRGDRTGALESSWGDRPEIRQWLAESRSERGPSWLGVIWVEDLAGPRVAVSQPVYRDGTYVGSISSVVAITALSDFLSEINRDERIHSFILYGRDQVLAHPALAGGPRGVSPIKLLPALGEVNDAALAAIWNPQAHDLAYLLAGADVEGHTVRASDDDYIYLYRQVDGYGPVPWIVGLYYRKGEVNAELQRLMTAAAVAGGILLLALVLALVIGRAIGRPITRLAEASLAIRDLDVDAVAPLRGNLFRELDSAAQAYNAMLGALRLFQTYLPRSLVLRLMRLGEAAAHSEVRQVTILFTDIVGFTGLSNHLAPAEVAALLNRHFAVLAACIEAEEGTLDKYIGDSIMAFWGAPSAQPDHAARAVRAALAMVGAVAADNRRRRETGLAPLRLRIGIHSGPAVVGNIGAPGRVNYTLIGDSVNVAQRLEQFGREVSAPEAEVLILASGDTVREVGVAVPRRHLGSQTLRGRSTTTEVFWLGVAPAGATP